MLIKTTLLLCSMCASLCVSAQTTPVAGVNHHIPKNSIPAYVPSNIERYGFDYKVKNFDGDSTVLNLIDLAHLEQFRLQNEDVEVIDDTTGLTIILFFNKRIKNSDIEKIETE